MSIPQVRIIRKGHSQQIFIDDHEMKNIMSFTLASDMDDHPNAHLTITILCQIQEDLIDVTNLGSKSKEFIKAIG